MVGLRKAEKPRGGAGRRVGGPVGMAPVSGLLWPSVPPMHFWLLCLHRCNLMDASAIEEPHQLMLDAIEDEGADLIPFVDGR